MLRLAPSSEKARRKRRRYYRFGETLEFVTVAGSRRRSEMQDDATSPATAGAEKLSELMAEPWEEVPEHGDTTSKQNLSCVKKRIHGRVGPRGHVDGWTDGPSQIMIMDNHGIFKSEQINLYDVFIIFIIR